MNKIYGITGNLGSGKSSLAQYLSHYWSKQYLHVIELDNIRRHVLWHSTLPSHIELRKQLAATFSLVTQSTECWINRSEFTDLIFQSRENLKKYSALATPVLKETVKTETLKHPFSVIVWAYLLEEKYTDIINSKIIIMKTSSKIIKKRLINHDSHINNRIILEPSYEERLNFLKKNELSFIEYENNLLFDEQYIKEIILQLIKENE